MSEEKRTPGKCQSCTLGQHDQCYMIFSDPEGEHDCNCKGTEEHDASVKIEIAQAEEQMKGATK